MGKEMVRVQRRTGGGERNRKDRRCEREEIKERNRKDRRCGKEHWHTETCRGLKARLQLNLVLFYIKEY